MKYTIRDLTKRFSANLEWTANDDRHPAITNDAPHALVQAYIKYVTNQHALEYDKINEAVVRKAQMYREDLQSSKPNERELEELLADRQALVEKNRRLRRMAELSDDCKQIDKYCLEATVIRDLNHAIDFDEFKGCKGTSIGDIGYGVIDWDGEWFEDGHLDRNISEAQLEKYEDELLELIDMKERTAWLKINLKNNKIDAARSVATKAVEEFKTNFEQTRQQLQLLKHEVLRARLLERQMQEIKDDNADLERLLGVGKDDDGITSVWKK